MRIDVHAHYWTDDYLDLLVDLGHTDTGNPARHGYCEPLRWFWGLRLHLACTLGGLPVMFALTGAKADERETARATRPEIAAAIQARRSSATRITTAATSNATLPASPGPAGGARVSRAGRGHLSSRSGR